MEHNAPHSNAVFEGYYSKFDLPSGAHLAVILCEVKGAKERPYMVSFTYVPADSVKVYQRELWVDSLTMSSSTGKSAFKLDAPGVGSITWNEDSSTNYSFQCDDFTFHATTTSRTPWSPTTETPESLLVNLPLPLHWHVQSLASECSFTLELPASYDLPASDKSGPAVVHEEKNWAHSFPSAHMWLQAREGDRGFCAAGGQILGMEAFLLGYRSPDLNVDYRPPYAARVAGVSPTMSYKTDWESRSFELSVQGLAQKIVIKASAPKGSFFSLSSPFPEGHRENFLGQSFQATIEVNIFERTWLYSWKLVHEDVFEEASLEFGGAYYPPAGSKERFH